ncbi:thioredoxin family protein [Halalkalibacillus halophilus]|uniref:thioredoxin family protein n=1 Tax=Halalkalibacillus halophilus TaxID=392827 RepID=UPI0003F99902|nr:thioredoxin family protein [Halalkalibacillus halophilus]
MAFAKLDDLEAIDEIIKAHKFVFLYIWRDGCSVCHGLYPQIEAVMKKYPQIETAHINVAEVPEVAGRFEVFTVPVLLLFVDGKEYLREARIVQVDLFEERVRKLVDNYVDQ